MYIRNYRSIEKSALLDCGNLNVLVGKNNAGKSNVLSAIELMLDHLGRAVISAPWTVARSVDYFTHRRINHTADVAVEFTLDEDTNKTVRDLIAAEAPHLERSIDELAGLDSISFLLSAVYDVHSPFLFLRQIAAGTPTFKDDEIHLPGIQLLSVPVAVAAELHRNQLSLNEVQSDVELAERVSASPEIRSYFEGHQNKEIPLRYVVDRILPRRNPSRILARLEGSFRSADSADEFAGTVGSVLADVRQKLVDVEARETTGSFRNFSGETKRQPIYVTRLMKDVGSATVLRLKERKQPIGAREADALLQLKIRRGGEKRLQLVRQTVNALLGVNVDAFQPEPATRGGTADAMRAEIDVDDFLVEANGAGVREALRLILDFELNDPALVLIEEPEAHLHPGLARAIQHYLRDKSDSAQLFVTTHSSEFVDASSFENVYLVARDASKTTICQGLTKQDAGFRISTELGLRPSSLFMYDRLIFVEGASDEEVLREFATKIGVDFAKANVGFVQMGGVRNFAYFAAEATLRFLAHRRIDLMFIVDRDERDDEDVKALVSRLGAMATVAVLTRREIENYLLDPAAIGAFIEIKSGKSVDRAGVKVAIQEGAAALFDEALRLRIEKRLLSPIFLHTRSQSGTPEERLRAAQGIVAARLAAIAEETESLRSDLRSVWDARAESLAPGSLVLKSVCSKYSVRFDKEAGDSARLASLMERSALAADMTRVVEQMAGLSATSDPEE